jgi:hypothetical protein
MSSENAVISEILFVGTAQPSQYFDFSKKLHQCLGSNDDVKLQPRIVAGTKELGSNFAIDIVPNVVVFDARNQAGVPEQLTHFREAIKGIKALDSGAVVILMVREAFSPKETLAWLDGGGSGVLQQDFSATSLDESLRDLLSRRLHMAPRHLRMDVLQKIEVKIASMEQAIVTETLNLGVGGMFVRALSPQIKVGDRVVFVLHMSREICDGRGSWVNPIEAAPKKGRKATKGATDSEFKGSAVVVWVRNLATSEGPEGMGLQFLRIDLKTQKFFESYLNRHRVKSFIPLG